MRFDNQLKTFLRILDEYPADTPLSKFLPGFFKKNKQMGSTDRRVATGFVYDYFRIGKAQPDLSPKERLFLAEFLCYHSENAFLNHFKPELNEQISLSTEDKLAVLGKQFRLDDVFPFTEHLSNGINKDEFLKSLFIQPDLFIRIHNGQKDLVYKILTDEGVRFCVTGENSVALMNGTKLDSIFEGKNLFEVQDISSQQTGDFFNPEKYAYWWDACAASGGKSILLHQLEPEIKLLVSDIRESVLNNLHERFQQVGLKKYQKKVLDLTQNNDQILHDYEFDGIILDAPCTGSGTWGRTPEMISQFRETSIHFFSGLQKTIADNVVKHLKPGKPLIYITCSVFKEENEQVVDHLISKHGLICEKMKVLKGYEHRADTMFAARLKSEA